MLRYTFLLLLVSTASFSQEWQYQSHIDNPIVVYASDVNVRKEPSLTSKVIFQVQTGEVLNSMHQHTADTLQGKSGYWVKIKKKEQIGFLWNHLLAESAFRFHSDPDYKVLIKQQSKGIIGVKMFYKNTPMPEQKLNIDPSLELYKAFSLGVIYSSEGKEVLVMNFKDDSALSYQWDGEKLIPFDQEIPKTAYRSYRDKAYIAAQNVNIRNIPSLEGDVIASAQFLEEISVLKTHAQSDTINGRMGYWNRIKYKGKEGYVWQYLITNQVVKSLKEEGLGFVVKEGQIVAIKNGKIIHSMEGGADNLVSLGTLGVPGVTELLSTCHYAESCGQTSGDLIYSWNGEQLEKFVDNTGVGDGGLFEGNEVIFPSFYTGTKDEVTVISTEGESVNIPSEDLATSSYDSFYRSYSESKYKIIDQKLVAKPGEGLKISQLVNQKFKNYGKRYFKSGDFNKDGYKDAIVYASNQNYESKNGSMILILLGTLSGEYKVHSFNKNLIIDKENDPITEIIVQDEGFLLNIYYTGYYNEQFLPTVVQLEYQYEDTLQDFQLMKEIKTIQNEGSSWTKKISNFKTNKIVFKDSWHSELQQL